MLQSDSRRNTTKGYHQFSTNIVGKSVQVPRYERNDNPKEIRYLYQVSKTINK